MTTEISSTVKPVTDSLKAIAMGIVFAFVGLISVDEIEVIVGTVLSEVILYTDETRFKLSPSSNICRDLNGNGTVNNR